MKRVFLSFYLFVNAILFFIQFAWSPAMDKYLVQKIISKDLVEYHRELTKGVFHMMDLDLLRLPEAKWNERIEELKPDFGYPIKLIAFDDLQLDQKRKDQLLQGKIVVTDVGDYFYYRVGQSQRVLRKGPISEFYPDFKFFYALVMTTTMLIIAFPTAILILPFWRKLQKISSAAIAFGNGDFNVRAVISKRSSLCIIAMAFNTMADRIQQLINSHKELTNAVSHELRTPISRIRFGLEMLQSISPVKKKQHYIHGLQTDVSELEELVSELLTYARFDREKPHLQFGNHSMRPWLEHLLAEAVPAEKQVPCRLDFHVDDAPFGSWFEPKYLGRAVGNLVQNALRHACRQVQIQVERNDRECIIHVDDDGPGIPEADRKRIFEPFTRLDSSRSRISGGYGLGLAIVQRIVTWHDGSVAVSESPLGGARFSVRWPGFAKNRRIKHGTEDQITTAV